MTTTTPTFRPEVQITKENLVADLSLSIKDQQLLDAAVEKALVNTILSECSSKLNQLASVASYSSSLDPYVAKGDVTRAIRATENALAVLHSIHILEVNAIEEEI